MLGIVALGLFLSGVTIWPAVFELRRQSDWMRERQGGYRPASRFSLKGNLYLGMQKARYPFCFMRTIGWHSRVSARRPAADVSSPVQNKVDDPNKAGYSCTYAGGGMPSVRTSGWWFWI